MYSVLSVSLAYSQVKNLLNLAPTVKYLASRGLWSNLKRGLMKALGYLLKLVQTAEEGMLINN